MFLTFDNKTDVFSIRSTIHKFSLLIINGSTDFTCSQKHKLLAKLFSFEEFMFSAKNYFFSEKNTFPFR